MVFLTVRNKKSKKKNNKHFTVFLQVVLVDSQFFIQFTVVVLWDVHVIWIQSTWENITAFEISKNAV